MISVNLIPESYRKSSDPSFWRTATYILVPVAVLAAVIPSALLMSQLSSLQATIDANTGEISILAPVRAEFARLTRERTDLVKITDVATQLQNAKTYWSTDLARFINALPSGGGVSLSNLTMRAVDPLTLTTPGNTGLYDGKPVSREFDLSGQALNQDAVVAFLRSFETNPDFGVNFKGIQRNVSAPTGPGGAPAETPTFSFNATVGLVHPPVSTPTQVSAPAAAGTMATPSSVPAAAPPGTSSGVK